MPPPSPTATRRPTSPPEPAWPPRSPRAAPKARNRCADLLDHVRLAFADQFRAKSHETAFLGRVRSARPRGPASSRRRPPPPVLRARDVAADVTECLQDLVAGWRAAGGAVSLDGVVVLLDLCLDVEGDLAQQLLPAWRVRRGLDRRHRLLGGLDRAAGVSEREGRSQRRTALERHAPNIPSGKSAFVVMAMSLRLSMRFFGIVCVATPVTQRERMTPPATPRP